MGRAVVLSMIRKAVTREYSCEGGSSLSVGEIQENEDNNVQAMRDQGICDACDREPPFATMTINDWVRVRLPEPFGTGLLTSRDGQEYREARAYALAYAANL